MQFSVFNHLKHKEDNVQTVPGVLQTAFATHLVLVLLTLLCLMLWGIHWLASTAAALRGTHICNIYFLALSHLPETEVDATRGACVNQQEHCPTVHCDLLPR